MAIERSAGSGERTNESTHELASQNAEELALDFDFLFSVGILNRIILPRGAN